MQREILQLFAAFAGSIGFAIVLKIRGIQILYAGIGGMVTWAIYLMSYSVSGSVFTGNLIASMFVAVYAEIMARINKAPSTIFLTAAAVPLIPGRNLYYTVFGIISEDNAMAELNGETAIVVALAIAFGFVIVAVINKYINIFRAERKKIKEKKKGKREQI